MEYKIETWLDLVAHVKEQYGLDAQMEELLFFVGMQEYGQGIRCYSKDEKLALIKVGLCKLFSYHGLFEQQGLDGQGWPIWREVEGTKMPPEETQEEMLKASLIRFFRGE